MQKCYTFKKRLTKYSHQKNIKVTPEEVKNYEFSGNELFQILSIFHGSKDSRRLKDKLVKQRKTHRVFGFELAVCVHILLLQTVEIIISTLGCTFSHSVFEGIKFCVEDF